MGASVECEQTRLIHGGPTEELTGLKRSVVNILVQTSFRVYSTGQGATRRWSQCDGKTKKKPQSTEECLFPLHILARRVLNNMSENVRFVSVFRRKYSLL